MIPRTLDILSVFAIAAILAFAFFWQVAYHELPCPLCILQRVAFAMVGVAFLLNVRFFPSPVHYGMAILSALAGAAASTRQVLLHIAPGDQGYGSPIFGYHFYTLGLVAFVAIIAYCGVMLMLWRYWQRSASGGIALAAQWLLLAMIAGNAVTTTLQCGFYSCPDNPTRYLWLGR